MAAADRIPQPMDHHEKAKFRAAAFRATRLYPGPVGELISREIMTWEDFGYRLGGNQLINRLIDVILKTDLPYPSVDNRDPQPQPRRFFTGGNRNA